MESASKVSVSRSTLEELCRLHLSAPCLSSEEVSEGWFNTIHRMVLTNGKTVALKIAPSPQFVAMRYERDILNTEIEVLRLLKEEGLAVPQVLAEGRGGETLGYPWFAMEWLSGQPLNKLRPLLTPEQRDKADSGVAWQTARVHLIVGDRFGRWQPDHTASSSWAESFGVMVDDLLSDAADKRVDLPVPHDDFRRLVEAGRGSLDQVREPRLVLWDLHDGNVIVNRDSLQVEGFLDTDRALWGDPLMDFYFRDLAASSPAWWASYRDHLQRDDAIDPTNTPGADQRLALYELYLALVMVIEVAYRGFTTEHEAWTRDYLRKALAKAQDLILQRGTP